MYLAHTTHVPGLHLACTWLAPRMYLASTWLWGRIGVALGAFARFFCILNSSFCLRAGVALAGFARPFGLGSWLLDVECSVFPISNSNTTPLPRLPHGGLGAPWNTLDIPWTRRPPSKPHFQSGKLIQVVSLRLCHPEAVFGFGCGMLDVGCSAAPPRAAGLTLKARGWSDRSGAEHQTPEYRRN